MIKKVVTYTRYLYDFLKHGDILSIFISIQYILNRKVHSKDRIIRTSIGTFFCRKGTNDFQFANYYYEWGVKKYLLDHIREYSVFIDGGACTGDYCILLAKRDISCFAFEPVKQNFDTLAWNLELNGLSTDVHAFPFGLSDRNSEAAFKFNPVNTGASHIIQQDDQANCRVNLRTLDSLIQDLKINIVARIMIKLDVEGMEVEAIRGAAEFLRIFPYVTLIIEHKHTGDAEIRECLEKMALFDFDYLDEYNLLAKKIGNKPT